MRKWLRIIAIVLMIHVIAMLPWRLAILGTEAAIVTPGLTRMSQNDNFYWDAMLLESKLVEVGYTVDYVDGMEKAGVYGLTTWDLHQVRIEKSLRWNDRYKVLAHEAGHVLAPLYLKQGVAGEMFAESVAALVCRCGYREHARYLASARGSLTTLFWYWPDIYRAAAFLR